ncbi:hypothetical protein H8959_011253 [Pygathrix nigripes]
MLHLAECLQGLNPSALRHSWAKQKERNTSAVTLSDLRSSFPLDCSGANCLEQKTAGCRFCPVPLPTSGHILCPDTSGESSSFSSVSECGSNWFHFRVSSLPTPEYGHHFSEFQLLRALLKEGKRQPPFFHYMCDWTKNGVLNQSRPVQFSLTGTWNLDQDLKWVMRAYAIAAPQLQASPSPDVNSVDPAAQVYFYATDVTSSCGTWTEEKASERRNQPGVECRPVAVPSGCGGGEAGTQRAAGMSRRPRLCGS